MANESEHPAELAGSAVIRFLRGQAAMMFLVLGMLLLSGAWAFGRQLWVEGASLGAAIEEVPARVEKSYWRAVAPAPQYREVRGKQLQWLDRFDFVAATELGLGDAGGGGPVQRVAVEDPLGARSISGWPPNGRFERLLPHRGVELRFDPATLAEYKAMAPRNRYGDRSRPDWVRSEYDTIVEDVDDPLRETMLAWTHPESLDVSLWRDPAHSDVQLMRAGGGASSGWGPLISGAGIPALMLALFGLVLSLGAVATLAGPGRRTYWLAYLALLVALPWWAPHVFDLTRRLSPAISDAVEGQVAAMGEARIAGAARAVPAVAVAEEGIVRFDAERSAYAGVWRRFQLKRPADCCFNQQAAFRTLRVQVLEQLEAMDDASAEEVARAVAALEASGHGRISALFTLPFDAMSREGRRSASARTAAVSALRWIARYPVVDRSLEAAVQEDLARLAAHPDAQVVESARRNR